MASAAVITAIAAATTAATGVYVAATSSTPKPTPIKQRKADPEQAKRGAENRQRQSAQRAAGRSSTVLTSPRGLEQASSTARRTILGG